MSQSRGEVFHVRQKDLHSLVLEIVHNFIVQQYETYIFWPTPDPAWVLWIQFQLFILIEPVAKIVPTFFVQIK